MKKNNYKYSFWCEKNKRMEEEKECGYCGERCTAIPMTEEQYINKQYPNGLPHEAIRAEVCHGCQSGVVLFAHHEDINEILGSCDRCGYCCGDHQDL